VQPAQTDDESIQPAAAAGQNNKETGAENKPLAPAFLRRRSSVPYLKTLLRASLFFSLVAPITGPVEHTTPFAPNGFQNCLSSY
jgi:hypothetical protein